MAKEGLDYRELVTRFKAKNFAPVYFFYGEEQFLIEELQALLIEEALQPFERDFNLDIVYAQDTDAAALLALCSSYPVMAERRLVLVRHFERLAGAERFTAYVKQPNPSAVVALICSGKPNLTKNPFRALKAGAQAAEFKPLYEREMSGWIERRVRAAGREMDPAAVQMLTQLTGTNLRAAAGEIEKLVTYVGDRTSIHEDDVLDVGGHSREFNVFELQRAVSTGHYVPAVRIMERMLQLSSNRRGTALMVVSVLTAFYLKLRKLAACREKGIPEKQMAERIGVPSFFIKEYLATLSRTPRRLLAEAFGFLLAADFELKGGSGREEGLILTLLLRRLTTEMTSR